MIRTGIYKSSQLRNGKLSDVFGKEKNISLNLYNEPFNNAEENDKFSEVILNRFNSDRNVVKRTYAKRFDNFDRQSIDIIQKQDFASISIFDVGISDGRASAFFLKRILETKKDLSYVGTDLVIKYLLYKKNKQGKSYIITDESHNIIEITFPPFVWNIARGEGKVYFLNNFLKQYFLNKALREFRTGKYQISKSIDLIHRDLKDLLSTNNNISVMNFNLLNKLPGKYQIIRAMNIVHFGYFSINQIEMIILNIYESLHQGGLLIEGSNENPGSPVEGAIYRKTENGFSLLSEPEKPSRISKVILSFNANNKDFTNLL